MRKLAMVILMMLVMAACSYEPPWWGDAEDGNATYMPPGLPVQPTLIYPELPWNHPCNDISVTQLPGACP